jgi:hypothetical protein
MIRSGLLTHRYAQTPAAPSARTRSAAIQRGNAGARRSDAARPPSPGARSVAIAERRAGSAARLVFPLSAAVRARAELRAGRLVAGRPPAASALDTPARVGTRLVALRAPAFAGAEETTPTLRIRPDPPSRAAFVAPRGKLGLDAAGATTTRPVRGTAATAPVTSTGSVWADDGLVGSGAGVEVGGADAGGDAGCSAAGGEAEAIGALDAGAAAGAGGGLGAPRGGSSPSGSMYVSPSPTLIPRWMYDTSCSASPVGPGSAIAAPSATVAPLRVRSDPRCVRETL